MNSRLIAGLCLGISLLPIATQANDFGGDLANLATSRVLENSDGRYAHWNGIGRFAVKNGLHCTATLLDTRSPNSAADAAAYLLTSGHCVEKRNGRMVVERPVEGSVQFNYFTDTTPQTFALKRINWSSMQGVDIALVELQEPLSAVIAAGIAPLRIAGTIPANGQDILLVGAPLRMGTGHLRLAACTQQDSAEVLEQPWFWRHTVKNQCRDVRGGSSGSPVLNRATNEVFAVLGTTTQGETTGHPTEALPGAPMPAPDSNYGSPVTFLQRCFKDGVLSQDPVQCPLFPAFSVEFKSPVKQYAKISLGADGQPVYPGWDLRFTLDTPRYRYKKVELASQCENPDHYSGTLPAKDARIDDLIGPHAGINLLCIVGVNSVDERPMPGLMRNVLTLGVELLAAGPTDRPMLTIKRDDFGYVAAHERDPRRFSYYMGKSGPPHSTDCADPDGYRKLSHRPRHFLSDTLPLKVCTRAYGMNDQPSLPREDLLPELPEAERRTPNKTRFTYIGLGDEPVE